MENRRHERKGRLESHRVNIDSSSAVSTVRSQRAVVGDHKRCLNNGGITSATISTASATSTSFSTGTTIPHPTTGATTHEDRASIAYICRRSKLRSPLTFCISSLDAWLCFSKLCGNTTVKSSFRSARRAPLTKLHDTKRKQNPPRESVSHTHSSKPTLPVCGPLATAGIGRGRWYLGQEKRIFYDVLRRALCSRERRHVLKSAALRGSAVARARP